MQWPLVQAYAGDKLGYAETTIDHNMTIAVLDVGSVDGADEVTQVTQPAILCFNHACMSFALHMSSVLSLLLPSPMAADNEVLLWAWHENWRNGLAHVMVVYAGCCARESRARGGVWRYEPAHDRHQQRA